MGISALEREEAQEHQQTRYNFGRFRPSSPISYFCLCRGPLGQWCMICHEYLHQEQLQADHLFSDKHEENFRLWQLAGSPGAS